MGCWAYFFLSVLVPSSLGDVGAGVADIDGTEGDGGETDSSLIIDDKQVMYEWDLLTRGTFRYFDKLKMLRNYENRVLSQGRPMERFNWPMYSDSITYLCSVPFLKPHIEEEEKEVEETSMEVEPFLSTLDENCIYRWEGWWTYEFCYGKHIRQFHQEQDGSIAAQYYLGYDKDRSSGVPGLDFYSEEYESGSVCDLTGKARSSEIRFYCDANIDVTVFASIKEPSSCHYVIRIDTPLLCKHPKYASKLEEDTEKILCFETPVPSTYDEVEYEERKLLKQKSEQHKLSQGGGSSSAPSSAGPSPAPSTIFVPPPVKSNPSSTLGGNAAVGGTSNGAGSKDTASPPPSFSSSTASSTSSTTKYTASGKKDEGTTFNVQIKQFTTTTDKQTQHDSASPDTPLDADEENEGTQKQLNVEEVFKHVLDGMGDDLGNVLREVFDGDIKIEIQETYYGDEDEHGGYDEMDDDEEEEEDEGDYEADDLNWDSREKSKTPSKKPQVHRKVFRLTNKKDKQKDEEEDDDDDKKVKQRTGKHNQKQKKVKDEM